MLNRDPHRLLPRMTASLTTGTCPACGSAASGKFCSACGASLAARSCLRCRAPLGGPGPLLSSLRPAGRRRRARREHRARRLDLRGHDVRAPGRRHRLQRGDAGPDASHPRHGQRRCRRRRYRRRRALRPTSASHDAARALRPAVQPDHGRPPSRATPPRWCASRRWRSAPTPSSTPFDADARYHAAVVRLQIGRPRGRPRAGRHDPRAVARSSARLPRPGHRRRHRRRSGRPGAGRAGVSAAIRPGDGRGPAGVPGSCAGDSRSSRRRRTRRSGTAAERNDRTASLSGAKAPNAAQAPSLRSG